MARTTVWWRLRQEDPVEKIAQDLEFEANLGKIKKAAYCANS